MKFTKTLFCFLLLLACDSKIPTEPNGGTQLPQWPMFGGNLRNTANAADPVEYYVGPVAGQVVWIFQFQPREVVRTSPSIASDGTIRIATHKLSGADSGFVYALNNDETLKWQFTTERGAGAFATGAIGTDDTYFIGSIDRFFYAIDLSGRVKWKKQFSFAFGTHRPAIARTGEIILPIESGVIALDESSGDTVWFHPTTTKTVQGISFDVKGNIYTSTLNGVICLAPDGKKKWEFMTALAFQGSPIIQPVIASDGTILFTLTDSLLFALNPVDGALEWTFNMRGTALSNVPCIAQDGSITIVSPGSTTPRLFWLNSGGELLWDVRFASLVGTDHFFLGGHPIIDGNGTIYLAVSRSGGDNFYAFGSEGLVRWSLLIENPSVVISSNPVLSPDGTLYVAGELSLYAIR